MNLQGIVARIEALLGSAEKHAATTAERDRLAASVSSLTSERDAAVASAASIAAERDTLTAKLADAAAKVQAAEASAASAKAASDAAIAEANAAKEKAVSNPSAAALAIVAQAGHSPIQSGVGASTAPASQKIDPNLTGLDRAKAAFALRRIKTATN